MLENKDVGFAKVWRTVEVKIEAFPSHASYLDWHGELRFKRCGQRPEEGLGISGVGETRQGVAQVDEREVNMTPGMAVTTEIAIGQHRLITIFLDPLCKPTTESLRER